MAKKDQDKRAKKPMGKKAMKSVKGGAIYMRTGTYSSPLLADPPGGITADPPGSMPATS